MSDTIIKIAEKTENFSIILNEVAKRKDLSARAKGIYYYLMTLPKDWKLYKEELVTHFTEGKDAINTAFKELEKAGYITKTQLKRDGKFDGWEYKIYESSESGLPDAEKPKAEIPYTGNPPLLNTNIILSTKQTKEKQQKEEDAPDKPAKSPKHKHGEYKHVLLTSDQYLKLCEEWGEPELLRMIKELDEGIEVKGYKYNNHNLALRKWKTNEKNRSGGYSKPLPVHNRDTMLDLED